MNITYRRIVSPAIGRIGLRVPAVGNYVFATDTTGIVVVVQMQPISVLFKLPEDDLSRFAKRV